MRTVLGRMVRDTLEELVAPPATAIVAVDVQNDFCHADGHFSRNGKDISMMVDRVPTIVSFIRSAQDLGVPVIFIQQTTLPDGRSDSTAWLRFKTRDGKTPDYTLDGSWGQHFVEGLEPRKADTVVKKYRPDAFRGTNLDLLLKCMGIETCVILGTTTEGCVESTVRAASYHDYYTVVVRDCLASTNPVLHEGSMRFYEARYPLHTHDEILAAMGDAAREAAE